MASATSDSEPELLYVKPVASSQPNPPLPASPTDDVIPSSKTMNSRSELEELFYLPPPNLGSSQGRRLDEGMKEKMIRKCKENPLVPTGALVTAGNGPK